MRELLKLIICEFRKLKRKRMFQAAFFTTFIMPLLYTLIIENKSLENIMSISRQENGFLVLIPLSAVVAASLFFEEHDYDTLKNLVCVPISKSRLAAAKIFVMLLFDVAYELAGYAFGLLLTIAVGTSVEGWALQLFLNFCTGIFIWAAVMPCLLLVVWFNKSYIISVIIAFAYAMLGYILHISDAFLRVPLGLNVATFLPVPMIFRWLYQYVSIEGAGEIMTEFYNGFKPYFVSTPVLSAILMSEAAVCMVLLMHIYRKQD